MSNLDASFYFGFVPATIVITVWAIWVTYKLNERR